MNITEGHFPFRLLFIPLGVAACLGAIVATATDGWSRPIGRELYLFFSAWCAWWAFLMVKSGVAPTSIGPHGYRRTSPVIFWFAVATMLAMSLVFGVFGFDT